MVEAPVFDMGEGVRGRWYFAPVNAVGFFPHRDSIRDSIRDSVLQGTT